MASLKLVNIEEVSKFVQRCMCCIGTNPEHARQLAELLVAADCRGHFSHGLNRLGNNNSCYCTCRFVIKVCIKKFFRHIIRVTLHKCIYNIMLFTFILHLLVN